MVLPDTPVERSIRLEFNESGFDEDDGDDDDHDDDGEDDDGDGDDDSDDDEDDENGDDFDDDDIKCGWSRGSMLCCQYDQYLAVSMPVLFSDDDGGEYEINDVNDDSLSIYIKTKLEGFP